MTLESLDSPPKKQSSNNRLQLVETLICFFSIDVTRVKRVKFPTWLIREPDRPNTQTEKEKESEKKKKKNFGMLNNKPVISPPNNRKKGLRAERARS
jgi:hypothetical protein